MNSFRPESITSLTEPDLQRLVSGQSPESSTLEFKQTTYADMSEWHKDIDLTQIPLT